jgi:hypothetical protein
MCRESSTHNDHDCVLDIVNVAEQIIVGQCDVERRTTVRKLLQKSLRLGSSLIEV